MKYQRKRASEPPNLPPPKEVELSDDSDFAFNLEIHISVEGFINGYV